MFPPDVGKFRMAKRTQETFGAAAPGRRVLYSASWVLSTRHPRVEGGVTVSASLWGVNRSYRLHVVRLTARSKLRPLLEGWRVRSELGDRNWRFYLRKYRRCQRPAVS